MTLDDAEYHVLALLPDGSAPLSIVLPEARHFSAPLATQSPAAVVYAAERLRDRRLIDTWIEDPYGARRDLTAADIEQLADDYVSGARDPDTIRQILDRDDLWLEITEQGREELFGDPRTKG